MSRLESSNLFFIKNLDPVYFDTIVQLRPDILIYYLGMVLGGSVDKWDDRQLDQLVSETNSYLSGVADLPMIHQTFEAYCIHLIRVVYPKEKWSHDSILFLRKLPLFYNTYLLITKRRPVNRPPPGLISIGVHNFYPLAGLDAKVSMDPTYTEEPTKPHLKIDSLRLMKKMIRLHSTSVYGVLYFERFLVTVLTRSRLLGSDPLVMLSYLHFLYQFWYQHYTLNIFSTPVICSLKKYYPHPVI